MSLILRQQTSANVPSPDAGKSTLFIDSSNNINVKDSAGNIGTTLTSTNGNLTLSGNLTANGIKTDNFYYANSQPYNFLTIAGSNTQVQFNNEGNLGGSANFTFDTVTNALAVGGNISANGLKTDNIYYANGSPWDMQQPSGANTEIQYNNNNNFGASANFTYNDTTQLFVVLGNVQFNNANLGNLATANFVTGTLTTNAQPNITSVGTLTSLDVTGNISSGNANLGNLVTANFITGTLTTASQPNITSVGTLGSLTVTGNVDSNNLTTTNKITAGNGLQVTTGALSVLAGNLDVTGNLNVTGNVNYSNVTDLVVGDPLIFIGANNSGDTYDLGFVAEYYNGSNGIHTGLARNAGDDIWTFFDGVVNQPTTTIDWANATYPTVKLGNLITTGTANFAGNITAINANLGNLATANFVTGTLTTNAQPNITSVGTLTSLDVTGNITAVNITANTGIFTGNGSGLTSLDAGNLSTGTVPTARLATGTANSLTYLRGDQTWDTVTTGISVTDDTTTNSTYYPTLTTATTGSISGANVSSTKLYYNPSTGQLSATDFNSLSDINFKTNVTPLVNGMLVIENINPVSFEWKDNSRKAFGIIAQEIEKVIPEIVTTNSDGIKTVSYDQIIPFLISAIKDLNEQIKELKKK